MNGLGSDIWTYACKFLSLSCLGKFSTVSSQWCQFINHNAVLWKRIDIRDQSSANLSTPVLIRLLKRSGTLLRSVVLDGCEGMNDSVLQALVKQLHDKSELALFSFTGKKDREPGITAQALLELLMTTKDSICDVWTPWAHREQRDGITKLIYEDMLDLPVRCDGFEYSLGECSLLEENDDEEEDFRTHSDYIRECHVCKKRLCFYCSEDTVTCESCQEICCVKCHKTAACSEDDCENDGQCLCRDCFNGLTYYKCSGCKAKICDDHTEECDCGNSLCRNCYAKNPRCYGKGCDQKICNRCASICYDCRDWFCGGCCDRYCEDCEPEEEED